MRRYDDLVEVRQGQVPGAGTGGAARGPEQFLWQGRLWKVRAVLAHWVETGPWWTTPRVRAVIGTDDPARTEPATEPADLLAEREVWRVEAGRRGAPVGRPGADGPRGVDAGVFDLVHHTAQDRWQLVGCTD